MKTLEQIRIETKLKLWDTPGFFQFLEDLSKKIKKDHLDYYSNEVKKDYEKELEELKPKSKFKQGKLPL